MTANQIIHVLLLGFGIVALGIATWADRHDAELPALVLGIVGTGALLMGIGACDIPASLTT